MLQEWIVDIGHSEIGFRIGHFSISVISGFFTHFNGKLRCKTPQDLIGADIVFSLQVSSIFTKNSERDSHLLSSDFFEASSFDTIDFASSDFERLDDSHYSINGILKLKGQEKLINITAHFGGVTKGLGSEERMGLEISGEVERKKFGLDWRGTDQNGNALLSDFAHIHSHLQFVRVGQNNTPLM